MFAAKRINTRRYEINLKLLIKALISGDYQQHLCMREKALYLPHADTYSVAGVAADLHFPKVGKYYYFGYDADDIFMLFSSKHLPVRWCYEAFDLNVYTLSTMSDNWSFLEAANFLTSFLPENAETVELQRQIDGKLKTRREFLEAHETVHKLLTGKLDGFRVRSVTIPDEQMLFGGF